VLVANSYVVAKAKSSEEIERDWALLETTRDKIGTLSKEGVVSFFLRFWQQHRNDAASGLVSPSRLLTRQETDTVRPLLVVCVRGLDDQRSGGMLTVWACRHRTMGSSFSVGVRRFIWPLARAT
jgi:hypothetical protein